MRLLFLFLILCLSACTEKPVIDPCDKEFTADFSIGEDLPGYGFTETDTIIRFAFTAHSVKKYTSYIWQIGEDTRIFHDSTVALKFTAVNAGQSIPIAFTATGNPEGCAAITDLTSKTIKRVTVLYPKGFGRDSLFEPEQLIELPYAGRWQGAFTDTPADTFSVYIVNNGPVPDGSFTTRSYGMRIYNLPRGCAGNPTTGACGFSTPGVDYFGYPMEAGYKAFYCDNTGFLPCCPKAKLYGRVDDTNRNKISITCSFFTDDNGVWKETKRVFAANRLL
ncbi:hypothetical protein SAMN05421788_110114 [Filimonas lacunae]|uniref:PKD domain-containing protein n=1 Tax=Filimonas lacunae TaxID=477680 RepID=A0A173MA24_9BACT|nr:hypothetical protein [Filimonas lacunae]BAV04386.1 hypothetical protein FLA_0374 [Filimonas lacunae]SIT31241.1 hypothetical protein SAMN05421788_110114 [Filimonas lacunae]